MNLSTHQPVLAQDVFVAPSAAVIGNVSLGNKASVWYGCVLKGRVAEGRLGTYCAWMGKKLAVCTS